MISANYSIKAHLVADTLFPVMTALSHMMKHLWVSGSNFLLFRADAEKPPHRSAFLLYKALNIWQLLDHAYLLAGRVEASSPVATAAGVVQQGS